MRDNVQWGRRRCGVSRGGKWEYTLRGAGLGDATTHFFAVIQKWVLSRNLD